MAINNMSVRLSLLYTKSNIPSEISIPRVVYQVKSRPLYFNRYIFMLFFLKSIFFNFPKVELNINNFWIDLHDPNSYFYSGQSGSGSNRNGLILSIRRILLSYPGYNLWGAVCLSKEGAVNL